MYMRQSITAASFIAQITKEELLMTDRKIEMMPFDKKVARTNYHVEFFFDENSKIDIEERLMRVIRQSIEDDLLNNVLS